jgi:DNA-binding NtrC family response regulator
MSGHKVLIVDDEPNLLESFRIGLELKGHEVSLASSGSEALEVCRDEAFDVVLMDVRMPGMDGLAALRELLQIRPGQTVLMLTAHGSLESAVEAGRIGASDYIEKPSTPDAVDLRIRKAVEARALSEENRALKSQLRERFRFEGIVGTCAAMEEVYQLMERIAATESTVLITGDTGTGKELVARALHYNGPRTDKRFYALHCAAIPGELLESELFGHEKGAFTGAVSQKMGIFEAADGGTLFLDEVGEMSLAAQVRLLRVLQEKEFTPVGSTTQKRSDVRLIAATNRTLSDEVKKGRFREDLFYRLNVIEIAMPPLRDRRDDIPLLVNHFLKQFGRDREFTLSDTALHHLVRHDWPGNVREVENVVERAVALSVSDEIGESDLPPSVIGGEATSGGEPSGMSHLPLQEARERFEQIYIKEVLTRTGGNITHAAKAAGIAWQNFHQKLKKYEIDAKSFAVKK